MYKHLLNSLEPKGTAFRFGAILADLLYALERH